MADPTRIWFLRHGEVEAPYVGTFTGATDVGLSDVGRHQAAALADFLAHAHVDHVISSPMARALDTIAPLAQRLGLDVQVEDGLREMDFGAWETKTWPDIERDHPDAARAFSQSQDVRAFPDGEDTEGFAGRVTKAFRHILEQHTGQSLVVSAHAGTNRAFLSLLTGMPYLDTFVFAQDYGCANAAAWDGDQGHGQIALLNVVPGPPSQHHGDGGRRVAEE